MLVLLCMSVTIVILHVSYIIRKAVTFFILLSGRTIARKVSLGGSEYVAPHRLDLFVAHTYTHTYALALLDSPHLGNMHACLECHCKMLSVLDTYVHTLKDIYTVTYMYVYRVIPRNG